MKVIKGGHADKQGVKCGLNADSLERRLGKNEKSFAAEMYKSYKENLA